MRFVELEFVVSENAKKIHKMLIRKDNILSIGFAHRKNPILYYLGHRGVIDPNFEYPEMVYLTQQSYKKIKKVLEEQEE